MRHAPLLLRAALAAALLSGALSAPTVNLDNATFTGSSDGVVNQFLGIPFGKPPIGPLRFNLPVPVDPYEGAHSADAFGPWCPQQVPAPLPPGLVLPNATIELMQAIRRHGGNATAPLPESEDCLSINVIAPATAKPGAKLPVIVWIFGGGFQTGAPSQYPGANVVRRSIELHEPVIYVSMNYRVTAFGFLAGKEVKEAGVGNLGMLDQRLALRWIQKYISAFGGDPSKVTLGGQSAAAIAVALHLVTNGGNTEGLFHGAFMQSGGTFPTADIEVGQVYYDALVQKTGCAGSANTLECLRQADYAVLKKAIDESPGTTAYQSLRLAWEPRIDGKFLTASPMELVQQGSVAKVPFITGNCDDDGTGLSFSTINITTDGQFRTYIVGNYFPAVPRADIERFLRLYPSDPAQGAPFGTGTRNQLTPQFKRISAFQGDWYIQGPRRFLLKHRAAKQKTWSYLSKRYKDVPILGAAHGTDLIHTLGRGELQDYLVHFVNHLDPNGKTGNTSVAWPPYSASSPRLLTFQDDAQKPVTFTEDTYRSEGIELLQKLGLKYPV